MTNYVEYSYSAPTHSQPDIATAVLKMIREKLHGGTICELGCGSGWLCHRLAALDYDVVGVDLSSSGIRAAQSANIEGARFVQDSIDAGLPERVDLRGQCDLVLSNDVIEHLYRTADLPEAARGLLRPGGVLIITTPYHGYLKNLAIAALGYGDRHYNPLWDGGHIKFFSPATLTVLLQGQGFKVDEFRFVGRFYGFWKSMLCSAKVDAD
jgi:2-polyprenyl-3-methyl-5-hydroxy-6-metoxy-1,4-benzoquinol methylase